MNKINFCLIVFLCITKTFSSDYFDVDYHSGIIVNKLWKGLNVSSEDIQDLISLEQSTGKIREQQDKHEIEKFIDDFENLIITNATHRGKSEKNVENIRNFVKEIKELKNNFSQESIKNSLLHIIERY